MAKAEVVRAAVALVELSLGRLMEEIDGVLECNTGLAKETTRLVRERDAAVAEAEDVRRVGGALANERNSFRAERDLARASVDQTLDNLRNMMDSRDQARERQSVLARERDTAKAEARIFQEEIGDIGLVLDCVAGEGSAMGYQPGTELGKQVFEMARERTEAGVRCQVLKARVNERTTERDEARSAAKDLGAERDALDGRVQALLEPTEKPGRRLRQLVDYFRHVEPAAGSDGDHAGEDMVQWAVHLLGTRLAEIERLRAEVGKVQLELAECRSALGGREGFRA